MLTLRTYTMRPVRLFIITLAACAAPLAAQVESPVPFDSAGQVMALTPSGAQRLQLAPPVWPVVGQFREARVYLAGPDRYVLVVERTDGARERFPMSVAEYEALRGAASNVSVRVRAAPPRADQPSPRMGENPPTAVQPRTVVRDEDGDVSRASFMARMMGAAAGIYGPAAAVIVGEPAGGTAAYLGVVSASFFASYAATRSGTTRAQSQLASDFAVRGAALGWLLADALNSRRPKERAMGIFVVGLASTIEGYRIVKNLTVPEVSTTTAVSTAAGLTAFGLMAAAGSLDESRYGSNDAAAVLVASVAGLPLGLWYHRVAPHFITSGDVEAAGTTGMIGALTGLTIVTRVRSDPTDKAVALGLTAGWVTGLAVGDLWLARSYDFTRSEQILFGLGTVAGGLAGAAPFVVADQGASNRFLVGATLGAALGAWGTVILINPSRGTANTAETSPLERQVGRVTLQPGGALFAAARMRGTFPLVKIAF